MISVSAARRRSLDAKGNKIIVYINQDDEFLSLISVFYLAVDFSDRLDIRRFVLEMRLNGHEFLISIRSHSTLTACSE